MERGVLVEASQAQDIAALIGAIGTVAAVLLALFLQVILVRLRRPVLRVEFSADPGDEDMEALDVENRSEYWIHAKVWNQNKRASAKNVEATLLRVKRPAEALNKRVVPVGPLKWTELPHTRVEIASGTWRRVDLLAYRIIRPVPSSARTAPQLRRLWDALRHDHGHYPSTTPILMMATMTAITRPQISHRQPSRRHHLDDSGYYEADFVLSCDDAEPSFWRLSFTYLPASESPRDALDLCSHISNIQCRRIEPSQEQPPQKGE
jgi:hypothetical protein